MVANSRMPKDYKELLVEKLKTCREFEYSDLIAKIILFGSAARGELKCGSDLDICIVWLSDSREIISILENDLIEDIAPINTDVFSCLLDSYERSDKRIIQEIRKDGVPLYAQ